MGNLNWHAERLFAEPCNNCGHPADAHGINNCIYPMYDDEDDPTVKGRECGCTKFESTFDLEKKDGTTQVADNTIM
jgi:hypothetical protein